MRSPTIQDRQVALALRVLVSGAVLVAAVFVFRQLEAIILPLLFAMLLTALLSPAVDRLANHVRRGFAVTLVIVLFVGCIVGAFAYITPALFGQASEAVTQVQKGLTQVPNAGDFGLDAKQTHDLFQSITDRLKDNAGGIGAAVGSSAITIASVTISVAFGAFLMFVLLIYFLIDGRGFWDGAMRLLPVDRRQGLTRSATRAWHALVVFIRSQVVVAAFDAIGITLGLLVLGVPLVLPLGVLTFILSFVPYIGATVSGIIIALVALSTQGTGTMIAILAIAFAVQMIEGHLIYPVLVGRNLRLHPITVLLAVGVGSSILGILGAFFATPILATVAAAAGFLPDPMTDEEISPHERKTDRAAGAPSGETVSASGLIVPEGEEEPAALP
ncbi:MAG: AI-2E family transporter [Solirubrobacteraceae bacterium]|nr:AI-2E family transporter [Patulibacter sp.]